MLELLSPVGNMDSLMAAINGGCDAVYLSGINFGARSFAGNFTNEEIKKAIEISHLYGVKVYVTVNTLIYDHEVERLLKYVDFLHSNNVDALIMQDIGMIDLIRKTYPNLSLHASTQLHIHNLEGVKFACKLGLKRVVLARETPISLINEIKKNTNVELEVFVHGALCMSYSGQCLMSALIGNRSGNRGTCAQCCRQPYSLEINGTKVKKNEYLLSTKDLCTLTNIGKLIDSGVESFKIEGRMKRPEYVYLVTSIYRKAIDNYIKYKNTKITNKDIIDIKKIFNREFTKGFLFNEENENYVNTYRPNHLGIELGKLLEVNNSIKVKLSDNLSINDGIRLIGENDYGMVVTKIIKNGVSVKEANIGDIIVLPVKIKGNYKKILKTTDYKELNSIKEKIRNNKKITIDGICKVKINEPLSLKITDGKNIVEITSDYLIEQSKNIETSEDRIIDQLKKLGNTIYQFNNLEIIKDSNAFVRIDKLNEIRREAIDALNKKRLYKIEYLKEKYEISVKDYPKVNKKSVLLSTYQQYLDNLDKFDVYYSDNLDLVKSYPHIIYKMDRVLEHLNEYDDILLVGELGSVYKYKNIDTDFSLNVFNSYSVAYLHSCGVNKITLSLELTYKQIKNLIDEYEARYNKHPNLEVIVSGYEEAMVCKYNMLKKFKVNSGYLIDRFNNKYKLIVRNNLMYIYNYKMRKDKENYFDIGVNYIRYNMDGSVL